MEAINNQVRELIKITTIKIYSRNVRHQRNFIAVYSSEFHVHQ